ncbi:DUF3168 domain-containing protein [Rhodobacteraceae bacterium]|nr:DUF3168 domain-containing protein [Paracoccaceae bacterium]
MSFGTANALQAAIYQHLQSDATLTALVGDAIFDEMPPGPVEGTYLSLGDGDVRDMSDKTGGIAEHRPVLSVLSDAEGFALAKTAAAAATDALLDADLVLARGRVVSLTFSKARARRVRAGQVRRIDLTFRAIVEDD